MTGIRDAFKDLNRIEIDTACKVSPKIMRNYTRNSLNDLLCFSAAGNSIDFFKEIQKTTQEMQQHIILTKDSSRQFESMLKIAKTMLFFADNAGEMFFDLPLVKFLTRKTRIYYVVKSSSIQNDLTIHELSKNKIKKQFPFIITSGNDSVGIELATLSKNLQKKMNYPGASPRGIIRNNP